MRGPGRVVGLDLGERRIGVALSDSTRALASPYAILDRSGSAQRDRQAIAAIVDETGATAVVVGLPIGLDGATGNAARAALAEARALAELLEVPVSTSDERLTTIEVERRRAEAVGERDALRRGGRGARQRSGYGARPKRARALVDDAAAQVMLQGWLDAERAERERPTP